MAGLFRPRRHRPVSHRGQDRGIDVFKSLFISLTALSAIWLFPESPASAQEKSECSLVRRRLEQVIKQPIAAPDMPETKGKYDVNFDKKETLAKGDCIEIRGDLFKKSAGFSQAVTIYVFFKNDNSKIP